jgi:hypothetical protein
MASLLTFTAMLMLLNGVGSAASAYFGHLPTYEFFSTAPGPFFFFSAPVIARREDRIRQYGLRPVYPLKLPTRLRETQSRGLHSTLRKANSARQRHPRLFLE